MKGAQQKGKPGIGQPWLYQGGPKGSRVPFCGRLRIFCHNEAGPWFLNHPHSSSGCTAPYESFQESGALTRIPNSRALIIRTPTKKTRNSFMLRLSLKTVVHRSQAVYCSTRAQYLSQPLLRHQHHLGAQLQNEHSQARIKAPKTT